MRYPIETTATKQTQQPLAHSFHYHIVSDTKYKKTEDYVTIIWSGPNFLQMASLVCILCVKLKISNQNTPVKVL